MASAWGAPVQAHVLPAPAVTSSKVDVSARIQSCQGLRKGGRFIAKEADQALACPGYALVGQPSAAPGVIQPRVAVLQIPARARGRQCLQ